MDLIDTPKDSKTTVPYWNTVLRYGGICGAVLVVLSLIFYLVDINVMSFGNLAILYTLIFALTIGVSVMGIKYHRDRLEGGYMTFGRAFQMGLIIAGIGVFISNIWNFILVNLIDPGIVDKMKEQFADSSWAQSMPPEALEKALEGFDKSGDILTNLQNGVIGGVIIGAIVGLIVAIFMKRDRPTL